MAEVRLVESMQAGDLVDVKKIIVHSNDGGDIQMVIINRQPDADGRIQVRINEQTFLIRLPVRSGGSLTVWPKGRGDNNPVTLSYAIGHFSLV